MLGVVEDHQFLNGNSDVSHDRVYRSPIIGHAIPCSARDCDPCPLHDTCGREAPLIPKANRCPTGTHVVGSLWPQWGGRSQKVTVFLVVTERSPARVVNRRTFDKGPFRGVTAALLCYKPAALGVLCGAAYSLVGLTENGEEDLTRRPDSQV